jgi:hypothetical protein
MALQVCPKCGVKAITWFIADEGSQFTTWWCSHCQYCVQENEKKESDCPHCKTKQNYMLVKDDDGIHRWCCHCGKFEQSDESF